MWVTPVGRCRLVVLVLLLLVLLLLLLLMLLELLGEVPETDPLLEPPDVAMEPVGESNGGEDD